MVISIVPTTDANNTTVTRVPPFVFIWEDPINVINSQYDGYKCALVVLAISVVLTILTRITAVTNVQQFTLILVESCNIS